MSYTIKEIAQFMRTYHLLEKEATYFLSLSAWAGKHKEAKIKSAQTLCAAIESYKQLPLDLREELEKDENACVRGLKELEQLARKVISSAN